MQWGAGAEGFTELHLLRNGIGRHRRSRLPRPHLRHAGDSPEACPQHIHVRREECAPAMPSDSGGAIAEVSARSGEGGGVRGGQAGNPRGQRHGGGLAIRCDDGRGARAEPLPS